MKFCSEIVVMNTSL